MRDPVHFRFPPELNQALTARSRELGQTRTEYVIRALEKALEHAVYADDRDAAVVAERDRLERAYALATSDDVCGRFLIAEDDDICMLPVGSCQICRPKRSKP